MGGLIIILAILIPTFLLADLHKSIYPANDLQHALAWAHRLY